MHRLPLRHRALWQRRPLRLSHLLRKPHLWLPKQPNRLKLAFLAGSKVCLVPAHLWQRLCAPLLLQTNVMAAPMAVQAVMVNAQNVLKAKASAAMVVVTKAAQKAVTHAEAVAVNAMALSAAQSVAQSAVMKHAPKVVVRVTPTVRMVAAHAKKPVLMLKAN